MRTPSLGQSVELPMGPRSGVLGGGNACGHRHKGLRWVWGKRMRRPPPGPWVMLSLWSHETLHW
eukprot:7387465-Pyramimonas_sp.AAC.1